jgi:hypothetical protein|tara:strand:- start:551 stop:817 length:267 start_codon:yes stop_codon:yes gene_type:complete
MALPKLMQMAGLCNNQYSDEVNRLKELQDYEIRIGRDLGKYYKITKQLREVAKKERKQWLKDTLEERKEAKKIKEQKKINSIFDEYFN